MPKPYSNYLETKETKEEVKFLEVEAQTWNLSQAEVQLI